MPLHPLSDHLIIKALREDKISTSGIVLPDTVDKERPERGEVIAVGPGRMLENGTRAPMEITIGQKVVFKKYSPDEIKIENVEYLILRQEDILAVMD